MKSEGCDGDTHSSSYRRTPCYLGNAVMSPPPRVRRSRSVVFYFVLTLRHLGVSRYANCSGDVDTHPSQVPPAQARPAAVGEVPVDAAVRSAAVVVVCSAAVDAVAVGDS